MNQPSVYLALITLLVLSLGGAGRADPLRRDQAEIQRLIQKLGSENFRAREAASRELAALGEGAEHALRKALRENDPEVRRRVAELVEALMAKKRSREMAALEGCWVLKTAEYRGEKADQDPVDDVLEMFFSRQRTPAEERELVEDASQQRTTLAFRGSTFEYQQWRLSLGGKGRLQSIKGTYRLNLDRSPKVLVRRWEERGIRNEVHITRYIYSLQGDALLMCFHLENNLNGLPARFATGDDEDVVLLTFKREKK